VALSRVTLDDRAHASPKHMVEHIEGAEVEALVKPERPPILSPLFDLGLDFVAGLAPKVAWDLLRDTEFGRDVTVSGVRCRVADVPDLRLPLTGILHKPAEAQNHRLAVDVAAQVEFELALEFVGKLREISVQVAADEVVQPLVGVLAGDLCSADVTHHDLAVGPLEHLRALSLAGGDHGGLLHGSW
jgi:hypothetical protein